MLTKELVEAPRQRCCVRKHYELLVRNSVTTGINADGILIFEQAGALPGHALQKLIDEIKALDMAEVRAKVDDQASTATASTGGGCGG